jgi:chorismate synthase
MGSLIGKIFQVMSFGESHGKGVGCVIQGVPSGMSLDLERIQQGLKRRQTGFGAYSSSRVEKDKVEILSGIHQGKTLGTPMLFLVQNSDYRPEDYVEVAKFHRPSHSDFTYEHKYGSTNVTGGGRASARETVARVIAGAVASQVFEFYKVPIEVFSWVHSLKGLAISSKKKITHEDRDASLLACPCKKTELKWLKELEKAKKSGDTLGGVIRTRVKNLPIGLGEPVFDKVTALIAQAMMSLPATRGVEFGLGFEASSRLGSEHNDPFVSTEGKIKPAKNDAGGVLGGLTSGEDLTFNVAFKPVSTIFKNQKSISKDLLENEYHPKVGRHDVCVLPRAVPMVEAMTYICLIDLYLRHKALYG